MSRILLLATLLLSQASYAGDKVGNGGGLWACASGNTIYRGVLVDIYEAREEYGLTPIRTLLTAFESVQERAELLRLSGSEYYAKWLPHLDEVKSTLRFVDAELSHIDDALFHIRPLPTTCEDGEWQYLQFANYTDQGQALIRNDLWRSPQIPTISKSALIWHEVIYRWLRVNFGDTNSIRARRITGILFSTLSAQSISEEIKRVLQAQTPQPNPNPQPNPKPAPAPEKKWLCSLQSFSDYTIFSTYASTKRESEVATLQSCEASQMYRPCFENQIACEQVTSETAAYFCEMNNPAASKTHASRGVGLIEAQIKTVQQCLNENDSAPFCSLTRLKCTKLE